MFENILGNEKIKTELINSVKQNHVAHSYLFLGTSGIGKQMIAKEFAKMILCLDENKYCNKCKSCIEFDGNNNPDFEIINPDGNSLKIEQIRDMQSRVQEKPIVSNKKVYIINDSDKMTVESQNCLLKTLEEPPEFVTIILIGENSNKYLSTIKSRCIIMNFENIENSLILKYLKDNYNLQIQSKNMVNAFQGSIGKALIVKEKQELYENVEKLINSLENKDRIDILNMADLIKTKEDRIETLDYMNICFIELAKQNNKYADCIKIVENTKKRINQNANYDMNIDNLLLNIWEKVN